MRLRGKVAIVTGASSGIGEATARLFADEGAVVAGGDINPVRDIRELDVTREESWRAFVDNVVAEHGRIDVLINNAGLVGAYEGITDIDLADWRRILSVNLDGPFLGMRTAIPIMKGNGGGSIVNVSSVWGIGGAVGVAAYQASKGAVRMLTKNAALTYAGDGIRANTVFPGMVSTPLIEAQDPDLSAELEKTIPIARRAAPRELANAVLFLASDEASYVTGAELVVDGGYLIP